MKLILIIRRFIFSFFLKTPLVYALCTCIAAFGHAAKIQSCSAFFSVSPFETITQEFEETKARSPYGNHTFNFVYGLKRNFSGIQNRLRESQEVRLVNAQNLLKKFIQFQKLTDTQLHAQWGARTLNLPESPGVQYLSPTRRLKRGDRIRLTRTLTLKPEELQEFLRTKAVTSSVLQILNYDLSVLNKTYKLIGLLDPIERARRNLGLGGFGIATTYAENGYSLTRLDEPLIYNPAKNSFSLQLEFLVPVEAIVLLSSQNAKLPDHVAQNPLGYGIKFKDHFIKSEAEITFLEAMPTAWLKTDLKLIRENIK